MDRNIEENFIKTFVDKRLRDRIIYELASEKHRYGAIQRFSSGLNGFLKSNCVIVQHTPHLVYEDILKEMGNTLILKKTCIFFHRLNRTEQSINLNLR